MGANIASNTSAGRPGSGKKITLDFSKCEYVPYFDSFVGLEKQNKDLTEVTISTDKGIEFHDTRGRGIYECVNCKTVHVGRICTKCYTDNFFEQLDYSIECEDCGRSSDSGVPFNYSYSIGGYICEDSRT